MLNLALSGKAVRSGAGAKLTWEGNGLLEYTIIRVGPDGSQTEIGRVTGNSFTDPDASQDASYIIRSADGDLGIGF